MNKMNDNKHLGLLIAVLLLFVCSNIWACSCIGKVSVKKAIKESDVVFMGKVLSKEKVIVPQKLPGIETTIYHRYYKFTFTIECKYKGKIKTDTVEIITGVGDGDCGYNFEIGKNYVVYSNWKKKYFREGSKVSKFLYTDICTRNTELVKKEDTEIKKHKKLCK